MAAPGTDSSGLTNWQASLRLLEDDDDQDSDTDSKLSGSALVDSVMKRLRSKHSGQYKDSSLVGRAGDFDHTLREQDEENEEYPENRRHPFTEPQSGHGGYNGYPNGAHSSPKSSHRPSALTSNSPRSQQRRHFDNSSSYFSPRKQDILSPVPEASSGARVVEVSGPGSSSGWNGNRRRESDDYPQRGLGGAGGRSMENLPHGSPGSRRRRNYEHTQIGVGGVAITNGRPGYRDVRVPPAPMGTADLASSHSLSQEVLPLGDHGYLSHNDPTSYNDPHGFGKSSHRRGSFGSDMVERPSHQTSSTSQMMTGHMSASAPQRTWIDHAPSHPSPARRRANYSKHEIHRDDSFANNAPSADGRHTDDVLEHSQGSHVLRLERSPAKGSEPNLNDVVDFLSSDDPSLVSNAASYLQHLAYGDDNMKSKIKTFGAIPSLVGQLRRPETRVQIAVLGALRNLSYGRANDENKVEIAGEHGLAEILLALRMSRVLEVRELLTSLLWNLSSCEVLKLRIIKSSIRDIVELALVPLTGWSSDLARDSLTRTNTVQWNLELRNITGTLRNVSSAGEPSRVFMRASSGLVDSLVWLLRSGVQYKASADEKTVENATCVLRNLSYHLENEVDPQDGAGDVLDRDWEEDQRRDIMEVTQSFSRSSPGCLAFLTRSKRSRNSGRVVASPLVNRPTYSVDFAHPDPSALPKRNSPVYGVALLWQPDIVYLYLALIEHYSGAVETIEAAAGAIQNITACNWKWAVYARNMIRTSNGLRLLAELLNNGHDAVVRASAMALRNLAIDPRNRTSLGHQVITSIIPRLPFGSNHLGISEETTIALLCCLMEMCTDCVPNSKLFVTSGEGVSFLTRLSWSRQHTQKINFAAGKLCSILYEVKEVKSALKREGWDLSQFQKMVRESATQYDFEPRVTLSRDYQGSRRSKKRSKKASKKSKSSRINNDDTESVVSGVSGLRHDLSTTSSLVSGASPLHIPVPRPLPPTVEEMPAEDSQYQEIPQDPIPIIYQSIDQSEMKVKAPPPDVPAPRADLGESTTSGPMSTSGPLSVTSQEESEPDPNATYASVDIEKKRASRRQKEREKKAKAQEDSWV